MLKAGASSAAPPEEDDDDELPPASLPAVAGDDELLQPDASARPNEPTLSVVIKRIFELCMGNIPPPELMKSAAPYLGSHR
jgi:hypothetical protein